MKITEDKHTLSFSTGSLGGALMMVSDDLIISAPDVFKDVMGRLGNACTFLEQFGLSGHFVARKDEEGKPAVSCARVLPLELNTKELLDSIKVDTGDDHVTVIAPSLSFCLYTGLRAILGYAEQLGRRDSDIHVTESTDAIKWEGHRVFSACRIKSERDLTSGVFVFSEDPECCLRLKGSYSSMEDKLISEGGVELDAPESIREKFREIYGKELLEQQIRDVIGNKEGD